MAVRGGLIIESTEKALAAARVAQEKKGANVSIIDVKDKCSYTDTIVIISSGNERQTVAIAEAIVDALKKEYDLRPLYREPGGGWSLIDYGDVIIHIFLEENRAFYDIDRMWSDAPRVPVPLLVSEASVQTSPTAWAQRGGRR